MEPPLQIQWYTESASIDSSFDSRFQSISQNKKIMHELLINSLNEKFYFHKFFAIINDQLIFYLIKNHLNF